MEDPSRTLEYQSPSDENPSPSPPVWLGLSVIFFGGLTFVGTAFVAPFDIEAGTYKGGENWAALGTYVISVPLAIVALVISSLLSIAIVLRTHGRENRPGRWGMLTWTWLGSLALIGLTAFGCIGSLIK